MGRTRGCRMGARARTREQIRSRNRAANRSRRDARCDLRPKRNAMKIVLFYHSLLSDWNHGNAHFLRGTASELVSRGHDVTVFEPADSWSFENLVREHGTAPVEEFQRAYPRLRGVRYNASLDLDE